MANNNSDQINSVLALYADKESRDKLEDLMALGTGYACNYLALSESADFKPASKPELIIADVGKLDSSELGLLRSIRQKFPSTSLVVVSESLEDGKIRELFKLQPSDWLKKPLDKKSFHDALLSSLKTRLKSPSQVHAVISATGGAGGTTIAISLADLMSNKLMKQRQQVALFDLDFAMGDCGYLLNCVSNYNLETVISQPSRVDAEFVDTIKQRHDKRFDVFSFKRPELVSAPTGSELVLRLLDAVSLSHEHTILDIPYYPTPWWTDALQGVNTITIVTNLNLPAIKHTRDLSRKIKASVPDGVEIRVVFNKAKRNLFGQSVKAKSLKGLFDKANLTEFSEDFHTLEEAVNRGILPSEVNSKSRFLKALQKHLDDFVLKKAEIA